MEVQKSYIFIDNMASNSNKRKFEDEPKITQDLYVFNTSPMKTSKANKDYFKAIAQTNKNTYMDLVCFQPKLHSQFRRAEQQKSPVKLRDAALTKGFKDDSVNDLKVTYQTRMSIETQPLNFKPKAPKVKVTPTIKLNSLNNQRISQRLNITAKVVKVLEDTCLKDVRGQSLNAKVILVADDTGCAKLTLWEKLIPMVENEKTYQFSELSVYYFDQNSLTTTPETAIKVHTDITVIDISQDIIEEQHLDDTNTTVKNATVQQVSVTMRKACLSCKHVVPTTDHHTTKCGNCDMRQLTKIRNYPIIPF
ncbi:uncharacterized protein LOC135489379 [Lineus longissimus]|uniref:uncharacterized protein LOC135489379 n=1 Tax=Lineus longissimus TaxID=88925 RepID=UPI00315DABD6